jgi:hypothetical protein
MTSLLPRIKLGDLADDFFDKLEKEVENETELVTYNGVVRFRVVLLGPLSPWLSRAQVRQMVSVQDFYKGILFEQARKALYSTRLAPLPKEFLGSTDGVCSEAPPHLNGEVFQLFWLVASDPAPRYLFRLSEQTWCPTLSQSSTRSSSSSAKSSSCRSSCSP